MSSLQDLVKNSDALLHLEPQELALPLLQELLTQEKHRMSGKPNRYNFSLRFRDEPESVQNAIMEAWAWLESSGYIAQVPQTQDGWFFVTRRGKQLAESVDTTVFSREQILPRHLLHPKIDQKAWSQFLRGEYDSAVFEAFKQLEVAIRSAGKYADTEIGVALARKAFDAATGPLSDKNAVQAEREALSHLIAGALGSYKNPHSHRNVAIKDASEAAEMIILASHLLRIVESRVAN